MSSPVYAPPHWQQIMQQAPAYKPSPWGMKFHALTTNEALGAGSAGPGKSTVLRAEPLEQAFLEHWRCELPLSHPFHLEWGKSKGYCLFLRRTTKMLEQTVQHALALYKSIDPDFHWRGGDDMIGEFRSGFKVRFAHCAERNHYLNYYSDEYTMMLFDELIQFLEEQYTQLKTRVRTDDLLLMKRLKVRAMSNPVVTFSKGENFEVDNAFWVRDYFVAPWPEGGRILVKKIRLDSGEIVERTRLFLRATLQDNPNPAFRREYEANLQDKPAHIRAALLRGDWFATADSFFGDVWDREIHICHPFKVPAKEGHVFRSMDWGFKKPGCVHWYWLDREGTLFVIREYNFQGKHDTEVAEEIQRIERDLGLWGKKGSLITGPADTQIWEKRGNHAKSIYETFVSRGVSWTQASKNREQNAQLLHRRMSDHGNYTKTPGIVFFASCSQAIATIPGLPCEPGGEAPMDGGQDHWFDSIGYGCAYASRRESGKRDAPPPDDDDDEDERPKKRGSWKRGADGYGSVI